jgi:hypothetical protein
MSLAVIVQQKKTGRPVQFKIIKTKNVRAVQRLLGHSELESTVCYLGVEVDDALEISEQVEI